MFANSSNYQKSLNGGSFQTGEVVLVETSKMILPKKFLIDAAKVWCREWDLTKPSIPLAKSAKQPLASNKSHNNLIHPLAYTRHQCSTPPGTVLKMRRKWWLISSSWTPLILNLQDPMIAFQISKSAPCVI